MAERRPSSHARGYSQRHKDLRKTWDRQVQLGLVTCARCKKPIAPGEPWDLGHDDTDRRFYSGPEHRSCNRGVHSHVRMRFSRKW